MSELIATGVILTVTLAAWALILVYALYNVWLLWLAWRLQHAQPRRPPLPAELPRVTIQLPVFNEETVVARLLEAIGRIEYPRDRLDVQLLDDSTDSTPQVAAPIVARLQAQGLRISHLRRASRDGFKAGALQAGLASARGELLFILDADFVPAPSILHDLVPWFSDPEVAMAQARWGYLHEPRSLIERCSRSWIDRHFSIEQVARSRSGQFFHFNGSAGMWRRAVVESAGGWSAVTLAEDLDLSFRAWRQRWKFIFDQDAVVPAELPSDAPALRVQQTRWARGAAQMAKQGLPRLATAPWSIRLPVSLHLTGYSFLVLLLFVALLSGGAVWARGRLPGILSLAVDFPACCFAVILVGQMAIRALQAGPRAGLVELEAAAIGIALAPLIFRAGVAGLLHEESGVFERTPKSSRSAAVVAPAIWAEAGLGFIAIGNALFAASQGAWFCAVLPLVAGAGVIVFAALTVWPAPASTSAASREAAPLRERTG